MALFPRPNADLDRRASVLELIRNLSIFFALGGWCMVGMALAPRGIFFALAGAGLLISVFARRAFWTTAVLEILIFSACGALAPAASLQWLFAGAVGIATGRAVELYVSRANKAAA